MVLIVMDGQCYSYSLVCLPEFGYVITGGADWPSDTTLLISGLQHGYIDKEWKEKLGSVYTIIASKDFTNNYHTFPIISSIALLLVTYFFSLRITGNRMTSLLAVMIVEFSKTFMWYSDSVVYPNFFLVCLMLSLYPFKQSYLKPIAVAVSFIMKAEALAFLPLTIIKEKDNRLRIVYGLIAIASGIVALVLGWTRSGSINYENIPYFYVGLVNLQQDIWILALLTPVTIISIHLWRKKVEWAGFLLGSMGYCLLFEYLLPIFTTYNAFGYRMLPFVVFFALSCSLILSKKDMLLKRKTIEPTTN